MARTNDVWETAGIDGTYIQTISPAGFDILINGTSKYLNFNTTVGVNGYGIRDNGGTMQFRNFGGSWTDFGSGGGGGTVSSVASADGSITVTNPTTTVDLAVVKAPILSTARTIGGVSFNGSANITVATATGGFTVSGGALALGTNDLTMTGSLGTTGARLTKGWFTDLQVTNAIAGSITGNAATVTTNANLTGDITSSGNATTLATVNSNVGSFGSSTSIPTFTVNAKGLITAASGNVVIAPAGTLSGTTLNATVVTSSLTSHGTITSGGLGTGAVIGGVTMTLGSDASFDIYYRNGSGVLTRLANSTTGNFLGANTGAAPSWQTPAGGGGLTIGTTSIASGTTTRILYDNAGVLGEYTITGTGTVVAMATSPVFTTPNIGAAIATTITIGTINYTPSNPTVTQQGSVNSYLQEIIQNTSTGTTGSADFIVNNSISTDSTNYGDFGMNSSGFTGAAVLNQPSYVYLTSTTVDLAIGTTTANNIHFVVNNGTTDAMTISSAGAITMNGNLALGTNSITMTGSIAATGSRVTKGWFTDIESTNMPTVGGTAIISDTAYASSWDGVTTVAPSKNAIYDAQFYNQDHDRLFTALGSAILFKPPGGLSITGGTGISNGNLQFVPIYVNRSVTLTGVKFFSSTAGVYTASNYNGVGLYSYSGGTLTLVASSTNNGNIWKGTANTLQTVAFTSTYVATQGVYFIGVLFCQSALTTGPALILNQTSFGNLNMSAMDYTNSAKYYSFIGSQTALPSTQAMSGLTGFTSGPWIALY